MTTTAAFTLADGAWIFGGVIIAWLLSIAYGYYTRRGSGINQRPHAGVYSQAPGAKTPSVLSHDQNAAQLLTGAAKGDAKSSDSQEKADRQGGSSDRTGSHRGR
jgi:hypothetical protein